MDRVLPEALQNGIGKVIEYAYSFEPMFAPTVVLGEYVSSTCQLGISGGTYRAAICTFFHRRARGGCNRGDFIHTFDAEQFGLGILDQHLK